LIRGNQNKKGVAICADKDMHRVPGKETGTSAQAEMGLFHSNRKKECYGQVYLGLQS
jgi:hypothetical protein